MYQVTITIKGAANIESVAQEIAQMIEQSTGEQCRVSVVDHAQNRLNQNRLTQQALMAAEPGMFQGSIKDKLEPGLKQ